MTEPIDLTDDSEATLYMPKGGDEGNKKRIVALAEGLNERLRVADRAPPRKRVKTAVDGVELPAPAPNADVVQGRGSDVVSASKISAAPAEQLELAPEAPTQSKPSQSGNVLLAQLHAERLARLSEASRAALRSPAKAESLKPERPEAARGPYATDGGTSAATRAAAGPSTSSRGAGSRLSTSSCSAPSVTVLTYNLWFNEDVALVERMGAVGETIEREGYPDFLLFQEVTQNIVLIFQQSSWCRRYHCSPVPPDKPYFTLLLARRDTVALPGLQPWQERDFPNSCMGRSILYTKARVGGRTLVVGTSHLESPVGPGLQQMVAQRQEQLQVATRELEAAAGSSGDVLLAGDLNWSEVRDGPLQLPPRWCDAWPRLVPGSAGLTWNPVANPMLISRFKGSRLDRVLCRLAGATAGPQQTAASCAPSGSAAGDRGRGWRLGSIKLVGTQALPGLTHEFKGKRLPVLPSDHFGLLVKLLPAEAAPGEAAATGHVLGSASPRATAALPLARAPAAPAEVEAASGAGRSRTADADADAAAVPNGGAAPKPPHPTSRASGIKVPPGAVAAAGTSGGAADAAGANDTGRNGQHEGQRRATAVTAAAAVGRGGGGGGSDRAARSGAGTQVAVDLSEEGGDDDDVIVL